VEQMLWQRRTHHKFGERRLLCEDGQSPP
jgi:hypothetical protein